MGIFFLSDIFVFCLTAFAVLYRVMLSRTYQRKKSSIPPGVCTYVRHAAFGLFIWVEHRTLGF